MFKELLFILVCSMAGTAMASEARHISIAEGPVQALGNRSHKVTSRLASLQRMFLKTPLTERIKINSAFGYRLHPVSGKWAGHQGIDYAATKGTPIRATAQGEVTFIGVQNGYGKVIFVEHDNAYSTVYAHQSRFKRGLRKGDRIEKGQIIGYVGSTGTASGPHLHYELRVNNQPVDPVQAKRQQASYAK
ncbi:M23 family metallopeptidase [Pollutimonas bauzanensis]|nr:M23 family metallopeptidase [Pollutimonas bauzanensis]